MFFVDGIQWRYKLYVQPHLLVHRSPLHVARRLLNNWRALRASERIAYVCADPTNSGDYASHLGIRKLVGRPGLELYCAPVALKETCRILARISRSSQPWRCVFVGGGGLLQGCFEPFWKALLDSAVPFVLFGVGAAEQLPQRRVLGADLIARIARNAAAIHVRDSFTLELIAQHASAVTVGICPSVIAVTQLGGLLGRQCTHLLNVVHEADLEMAGVELAIMRQQLRRTAKLMNLSYDETNHMAGLTRRLLVKYARAAIVVSSRLHGCIFSYAMDKPFVAVACDRKVPAFIESYAPSAPVIMPRDFSRALTTYFLHETIRNYYGSDLKQHINRTTTRMREILESLGLQNEDGHR